MNRDEIKRDENGQNMNRDEIKRDENGQNMFDRRCLVGMSLSAFGLLEAVAVKSLT